MRIEPIGSFSFYRGLAVSGNGLTFLRFFMDATRATGAVMYWRRLIPGLAGLLLLALVATALSTETVTITVEDQSYVGRLNDWQEWLDRQLGYLDERSGAVYVVRTPQEVFEVSSSFVYFRFDNFDRWQTLKPGATYRAVVTGWSMPWIGQYRNIVEVIDAPVVGG